MKLMPSTTYHMIFTVLKLLYYLLDEARPVILHICLSLQCQIAIIFFLIFTLTFCNYLTADW